MSVCPFSARELTVIVPSSGRPSLRYTIDSITSQMRHGDQLLCDVRGDTPWGNAMRERMMAYAHTNAILFMDDDDVYVSGALDRVRIALDEHPKRVHMFKMRYWENDFTLWQDHEVRCGNVAAQMVCVPNIKPFPSHWTDRREADFDFIEGACDALGAPVWHDDVIALVHHPQMKSVVAE